MSEHNVKDDQLDNLKRNECKSVETQKKSASTSTTINVESNKSRITRVESFEFSLDENKTYAPLTTVGNSKLCENPRVTMTAITLKSPSDSQNLDIHRDVDGT